MKTADIVKALPGNQVLKMVVPQWTFRSIPFPFYRNGNACLGFYFYPLEKKDDKSKIHAPIIQIVASYPEGNIVSIVASPFFLSAGVSSTDVIGEYPNTHLSRLSLSESNALYDAYYSSCDSFFNEKDIEKWKSAFEKVCEEGMKPFFDLFSEIKAVSPSAPIRLPKEMRITSIDLLPAKSKRFLQELQTLFSQKHFQQEAAELQSAIGDLNRGEFSIAVIGEFSRGKSTFLNNLFGTEILPVSDLPTTAVLTKIVPSEEKKAYFIDAQGVPKSIPLSKEALEQFVADGNGNDPKGVLQLYHPMPWLKDKRIRFYDTPGTGDAIGARADIVREVISRCDCTVMAVSAQAPCSMTEIEFLKENVLLKEIPRCIVLITKLDRIKEQERAKLIAFVKQRLAGVVPNATYWISHEMPGIDSGMVNAVGIVRIQEHICRMFLSDAELQKEREKQLLLRVGRILEKSTNEISIIEQAEKMEIGQKQALVEKLRQSRSSLNTSWGLLNEKCQGRMLEAEKTLQKYLSEAKESLVKDWSISLQRAPSPKDWVERDFPYMAEKSVKALRDNMVRKVMAQVMQDRTFLANESNKVFGSNGLEITLPELDSKMQAEFLDADTKHYERMRLMSRIATIAAVPVVAFLAPITLSYAVISGVVGLGAEFFLKNKIEAQKQMIEEKLNDKVSEIFAALEKQLHDYLEKCYHALSVSIKREFEKALSSALAKIEAAQSQVPGEDKLLSVILRTQLHEFTTRLAELAG